MVKAILGKCYSIFFPGPPMPKIGDSAPMLVVPDHLGSEVTLGNVPNYVMWFYPKADTPG